MLVTTVPAAVVLAAPPTLDQSIALMSVRNPRLSPDGRAVVYERQETDWKENAYITQLFLADVGSGRSVQLTRGAEGEQQRRVVAGRTLDRLPDRARGCRGAKDAAAKDGKDAAESKPAPRQIWVISPAGGEAWPLTAHAARIETFHWSKDGRTIAFTAPEPDGKRAKERKEKYGDYEVVESDFSQNQLWTVDVAAAPRDGGPARAVALTSDRSRSVGEFDWSPDSTRIAFAATPEPAPRAPVRRRRVPRGAGPPGAGPRRGRPARPRRCSDLLTRRP